MSNYTRQSSFSDGDVITSALFNNEYNQLLNAFAYASSGTTGHQHDGGAGEGGNIHTIGDQNFLNKIVVDSTNNRWGFFVEVSSSTVEQIRLQDGALVPVIDNDIDLGTSSLEFKDGYFDGTVYADAINFNGTAITATAAELNIMDGVTSTAAELNILDGVTASATDINLIDGITNGTVIASKVIITDANKDISGGRNITISGELDAATLDISGDADIDGTTNLDAVDIDGTVQIDGVTTFGVDDTGVDVKFFGATSGAYLLWDESADKLLTAGATTIDIVKDKLLIGSTAVTTTAAELNILDGVTSTTAELNILDGVTSTAAELNILDGVTSTAAELNILDGVTSTASELNVLDGITAVVGELNALDIGATAVGTAVASKAVILDSNKDYSGIRNLTISGELDAATGDFSGDVDIDGTLEADAITINGTSLAETISDTVGAMVGSNTETGITVTYEDGDNTLDFALGAAQTTITSLLATDIKIGEDDQTKIDFETADEIHFYAANEHQVKLVDGALVPVTDNDIDLGTSSLEFKDAYFDGTVTSDAFAGPLTGNVTGNVSGTAATVTGAAQSNITSLGTLTALTVDNVVIDGAIIGHTSDTDLMTLASGIVTVAGEVSMTTLDIGGTNVTSTAAELNILDGVTSTAAELNILDGVTSTAAELNILDGVTSTAAELNILDGVTSTAAELNYLDITTLGTTQASKAVTTDSNGDVVFPDGDKINFGTGSDFQIFHDGSNTYLTESGDGTGQVYLRANSIELLNNSNETYAKFLTDGAVELYHNNAKKLETHASGVLMNTTSEVQFYTTAYGIRASTGLEIKTGDFTRFLKGTTEYMRLDTNGKLGIGTSAPENPLTIQDIGGSTFNRDFAIRNGDASNYHRLVLGYNAASAASGVPTNAQFVLAEKGGGYGTSAGLVVGNSDNAPVMFTSNATERMRIANDGKVGVGTSGNLTGYVNLPESDYGEGFNWFSSGTAANRGGIGHYSYESRIYYGASDNLTFVDGGPSGTERMRINASGNVIIGSDDSSLYNAVGATAKLVVTGSTSNTNTNANSDASIVISNTDQTAGNTAGLHFARADTDNTPNYAGASIVGQFPDSQATGQYPKGLLAFLTSTSANTAPSEKMRMLNDGQLIIAGTSFNANGSVCIGPIGTSSNGCTAVSASASATNIWRFYNTNGQVGGISISGSATTFASSSDYRLKENVDYSWDATSQLKQLKPAKFNFIADPNNTVDGFIAHEVQEVVPHAVTGVKDGKEMQGIDHSKLVPLLTASLQEALKRIDSLEEQVNALKGK